MLWCYGSGYRGMSEETEDLKITRVKDNGGFIMLSDGHNLTTIPVGPLGIVALDSCKELGKRVDEYIAKWRNDSQNEHKDTIAFTGYVKDSYLIDAHIQKQEEILVVGLGNIYVTPDSLGPKVINEIDVTRHLINYLPQYVEEGTRSGR